MDTLLSVLMFMNVLAPGGTYNQSFINQTVSDNSGNIMAVEVNPMLIGMAIGVYEPLVPTIIIIDDDDNEIVQSN